MRRAFSLIEIMSVVAVAGVVAAAGFISIGPMFERSRRTDETNAALSQIRKMRAHALTENAGAALEVRPIPGSSGVRMTTAVVPRVAGLPQCQDFAARASSIERHDYELLDIVVPRASGVLCFEASAFRLLAEDGISLAPTSAPIDFFLSGTLDAGIQGLGTLTVSRNGTFDSTFTPDVAEGLVATVNVTPIPDADDPGRNIVPPRDLDPELPVFATPPPNPTTPAGQPDIAPLPTPSGDPPPPPPPACNTNADCPALFDCEPISKTCVPAGATCVIDGDCAQEEECVGGNCVYGCNSDLCPSTPACSVQCQMLACCTDYSCVCL